MHKVPGVMVVLSVVRLTVLRGGGNYGFGAFDPDLRVVIRLARGAGRLREDPNPVTGLGC